MTWAAYSLEDARSQLEMLILNPNRINPEVLKTVDVIRIPVGLLWLPEHLPSSADTVKAYSFWNDASGIYFDIIFMGWAEDHGALYFDEAAYHACIHEVQRCSKWRWSGEVDLLLLHFEYHIQRGGIFSFDETIPLPVTEMISNKKITSIFSLMQKIINVAQDARDLKQENPLWEIQKRIAFECGRRAAWQWISKTFLKEAGTIYDDMRPYRVCRLAI